MQVKKITAHNFKAISSLEVIPDGSHVILWGSNESGKTSIATGFSDLFQKNKPEEILKRGEDKGSLVQEFTDGSKIEWFFNKTKQGNISEKLTYTDINGTSMQSGVLTHLRKTHYGKAFNLDKFMNSTPEQQAKGIIDITGLDLSEIDEKISEKNEACKLAEHIYKSLQAKRLKAPDEVKKSNLEELEKELEEVRAENNKLKESYRQRNDEHLKKIQNFNKVQDDIKRIQQLREHYLIELNKIDRQLWEDFGFTFKRGTFSDLIEKLDIIPHPEEKKPVVSLDDTSNYTKENELLNKIEEARKTDQEYTEYVKKDKEFKEWVAEGKKAGVNHEILKQELADLKKERKELIKSADMPEGFSINESGKLTYNDFLLNSNQISLSGRYIAGLKLGSKLLKQLKTMHFEASALDNKSLKTVLKWADTQGLQLLVERPDWKGGAIQWDIISEYSMLD